MIIDTSALVAIVREEAERRDFQRLIEDDDAPRMSAASLLELFIVTDGRGDAATSRRLDQLIEAFGILIEPVTEAQVRIARQAYRDYGRGSGHPARLNFGDCFAYALASERREELLFKGDDFVHTDLRSAAGPGTA